MVRLLTMTGMAIDIRSRMPWPGYALSNFYHNQFEFDGVQCRSMEGFLQGLKCRNRNEQKLVCRMRGRRAKLFGNNVKGNSWYDVEKHGVAWNGESIDRHSEAYQQLLRRAYRAMCDQSPKFREALMATAGKRLFHTIGNPDPHQTILTDREFRDILTELRERLILTEEISKIWDDAPEEE